MRMPRVKVPREDADAIYHSISRTPNGEFLFGEEDKEDYRIVRERVAVFCGVVPLTYAFLDNHSHDVTLVPRLRPVSDEELLDRYAALYPSPTPGRPERIEVIAAKLRRGGPEAREWRAWMLSRTDISIYQQLLKQLVTERYNRRHERFGTLWAGRFKSVLVEPGPAVLGVMAYVDLNSVRAGIVADPKDYRFSGYAAAVAGDLGARRGIMCAYGAEDWQRVHAEYRKLLFAVGVRSKEGAAAIAEELCREVLRQGGKLSFGVLARCKLAYYTRGLVLGSQLFVAKHMQRLRERTGMKFRRGPLVLPETESGEWSCLTAVRLRPGELALA